MLDNIKMALGKVGCEDGKWIELAEVQFISNGRLW
jgi:hypothetical protein